MYHFMWLFAGGALTPTPVDPCCLAHSLPLQALAVVMLLAATAAFAAGVSIVCVHNDKLEGQSDQQSSEAFCVF